LRIGLCCAAFLLISASAASAATYRGLPTKMCHRWSATGAIRTSGTVSEGGLAGRFELTLEPATGRFVEYIQYPVFETGRGYDGSLEWSKDVSGASHRLNAEFARRIAVTDAWLASRSWCRGPRLQSLRRMKSAAGRLDLWRAVPSGGAPVDLEFDRRTGLLHRTTQQLSESRLITTLSQWRRLGHGPWMAYLEERSSPEDQSSTLLRTKGASAGNAAPAAAFRMPGPLSDHTMLDGPSSTVGYEDDARARVYIPVTIDGKGPFTFELDSGGHLILTNETAAALHLSPQGRLSSTGSTGVLTAGYVRLSEIRIGKAVLRNQPAKVLPLSPASSDRGAHPPRAGIIGLELFERFVVGIDPRSKTVRLSLPLRGARYPGKSLQLEFVEDAPLVRGSFRGSHGEFMLDTGNAGRTIIEHHWAAEHGLLDRLRHGLKIDDEIYHCDSLTIGPFRMAEIIAYDGPVDVGSESTHAFAAVLGQPLLSRFNSTYDYSSGKVRLQVLPDEGLKAFDRSGLLLSKDPGKPFKVDGVIAESSAARSGMQSGDPILTVNGIATAPMSRADLSQVLTRKAGTLVSLQVQRGSGSLVPVQLTLRDVLPCGGEP
jgi:hypothetical protein